MSAESLVGDGFTATPHMAHDRFRFGNAPRLRAKRETVERFDDGRGHVRERDLPLPVCDNTAAALRARGA
jgi:hypothetical protein